MTLMFVEMPTGNEKYRFDCIKLYLLFGSAIFLDIFILKSDFSVLGIISLLLLLSFCFPLFFIEADSLQLNGNLDLALKYAFVGYSFFFLGFVVLNVFLKKWRFSAITDVIGDSRKIRAFAIVCLIIYYLTKLEQFAFILQFSQTAIFIYTGLYIGLISQKIKMHKLEKIIFYIVLISEIIFRSLDGLLSYIFVFVFFIFICLNYYGNIKKIFVIACILFIYAIAKFFNPIKHYYRAEVWYQSSTTKDLGVRDRFEKILELNEKVSNQELILDEIKDRGSLLWRFSYQLGALAMVIQQTPLFVPYWNGSSYQLFSKLIPRFIWEDKPKEELGYEFGVKYGIISWYNKSTSMNAPIIVESYMNFGILGLTMGMLFIGVLYGLLNTFVNNKRIDPWSKCAHFAIIFPSLQHESNLTLIVGGIFLNTLLVFGISKLFK